MIIIITLIQFIIGLYLSYFLGSFPKIEFLKLLNATGLLFNISGMILLSDLILKNNRFENILLFLNLIILSALLFIPLSIVSLGQFLSFFIELPSYKIIFAFSGTIMVYVGAPLFMTSLLSDTFGEILKKDFYKSSKFQSKFFGWYLLLSGMVLQLGASIMDLLN